MGTKERREREKLDMQKLILDTAMQLFLDHGFENVTIRKIADKIEYSPATVYLYFKDKDEILFSLQKVGFDIFYEKELQVMSIKDPLERLEALGRVYIEFALQNQEYYDLMFIMKSPMKKLSESNDWAASYKTLDVLRQIVIECIEKGKIKNQDPHIVTLAIWSAVHGFCALAIRGRLKGIPKEHYEHVIKEGMNYLLPKIES